MYAFSDIDKYFDGNSAGELKKEFENRLQNEPAFAEEVAFYLAAREVAFEEAVKEKKERFKHLYTEYKNNKVSTPPSKTVIKKLWPYIAAAAMLTSIIIGWVVFSNSTSAEQLADQYIKDNFYQVSVTMGSREDSLQAGVRLLNEGKLDESLGMFESIATRDTASAEAIKYAGILCIRQHKYDKAISYFTALANKNLYANPGKFYQALALLKRSQPGDKQASRVLLQQVMQSDLEGKETAAKLLDKW